MAETDATETSQFQRVLTRNLTLPLSVGAASALVFVALIFYVLSIFQSVEHTQLVIGKANELMTLSVDMETGMRGFLLDGEERFLEPYNVAKPKFAAELAALTALVRDNPAQVDRLRRIDALHREWERDAAGLVEQRRLGAAGTVETRLVSAVLAKQLFDEKRREFNGFLDVERALAKERSDTSRHNTMISVVFYIAFILASSGILAVSGRRQIRELSSAFGAALHRQVESGEVLEAQAWLRTGQAQLAERLVGQLSPPEIGSNVLGFMAHHLGVVVGAFYVRLAEGALHRVAAYGFSKEAAERGRQVEFGDGLLGQAARDGAFKRIAGVHADYFSVTSALGAGTPADVVIAPIHHGDQVDGVLELGFTRPVAERDLELLRLVSSSVGAAMEAARYRHLLQASLDETRRLNEELQVQQEELRTTNEELEEQSRVLTESQTNLEHQKVELEQTNERLSEQAQLLDRRNEALRDAQRALNERADELLRASRYKSEFLANMSHELRTPLNSSLILAKLLHENKWGNLNAEQVKFAGTIYSAGNDLLGLINDILDISKVEAGKLELKPHTVGIGGLLENLRRIFTPLAADKGLTFEASAEAGAPASIFTDAQRLEQILKNLLSNAVKFTSAGAVTIRVGASTGGTVSFTVTDSGIGIDAAQRESIFEAFRQADGTINRRFGGSGLGLSISRELARLLGGSIRVESELGRGSRFALEVPLKWTEAAPADAAGSPAGAGRPEPPTPLGPPPPGRAAADTAPAALPPTAAGRAASSQELEPAARFADDRNDPAPRGRTVLVIEDDLQFATILYDLAHEMNYRCLVGLDAREGLELAALHQPNAILLDVRLPDGSGLGVLQRLKEQPPTRHIPVHIVAAEDISDVALNMGAVGFAVKPVTRDELRAVFGRLEEKGSTKIKHVLLVEDDARQRDSVVHLIGDDDVRIEAVERGSEALALLRTTVFDCMIIDLKLPDMDGTELLERMTREEIRSFPPVIVYTGRNLSREEEAELNRYSRSIIIKGARSPERLLDEVTLFLHKVESQLSPERQSMLKTVRNREKVFEGRKVLLVDDDVRNIFALTSALEQRGLAVEVGRSGFEALARLDEVPDIDLVLMDVMMPGMDGLEATRRIRAMPRFAKLPIIAVTAKAMKDDQEQCRRAGTNDYLAKPIDLDRLFSLLRVWMPSHERI